jgi:hypothetical protein
MTPTDEVIHAIIVACGWEERGDAAEQARAAYLAAFPLIRGRFEKLAALYVIKGNELHPDVPFSQICMDVKSTSHAACQYVAAAIRETQP